MFMLRSVWQTVMVFLFWSWMDTIISSIYAWRVGATCLDDIQLVPSGFSKITGGQCFPGTKRSGVQSRPFLFNHHGRQNKMNQVFQQAVEVFFSENFDFNPAPFPAPKGWQIKITDFMRMFISESTDRDRKSWFLFDLKWIYLYA